MARVIKPEMLGAAIQEELELYHEGVIERLNACTLRAVKTLVKRAKSAAPALTGSFKKSIAYKLLFSHPNGNTYVWYVKPPDHRITHLLAHGHATVNGGRVAGNFPLKGITDEVLRVYMEDVEEALIE